MWSFLRIIMLVALMSLFNKEADSQKKLTAAQWQFDIKYLQNLIHSQYKNLFYNVTAKQFDSAVAVMHKRIPSLTEDEIKVEFFRLVAMFKIGHTYVRMKAGENPDSLYSPFRILPLNVYPFSDGLYIRQVHEKYKEALGGKVIKIGDDPVDKALEKLRFVVPCENEQLFKAELQFFIRVPEFLQALKISRSSDAVVFTYLKNGEIKTITIEAEAYPDYKHHLDMNPLSGWTDAYAEYNKPSSVLWMKEPDKFRYFEYLEKEKILYVRHSAVVQEGNETIEEFFNRVFQFADTHEVDKFVLDIRLNGGGNNYFNKPVITGIIGLKKINRYGHFFVVLGEATFSAAQNLTNELEKYTECIFVGQPTSENVNFWGDTKTEVLPNSKLNLRLSWLWWQNMDPRDDRKYTAPQLAAGLSFDNYISGFDSAMYVIQNFKDEKPIDEKLKELVLNGNFEEARQTALQYKQNPLHRFIGSELETKLNDNGYLLMMSGKIKEGSDLLLIQILLFPESINAYDSYAESLLNLGKKDEAIKYYKIAVSKDPKGLTFAGTNSKKMLSKLQQTH